MVGFDFRVAFRLAGGDHINFDGDKLPILGKPDGAELSLHSGQLKTPIKEHSTAAVVGGQYPCATQAREAAQRARKALLLWAVRQRIGIDFGDGHARTVMTEAGRQFFERRLKRPVRNDVLGVDVYEQQENLAFVQFGCRLSVGKAPEAFVEQLRAGFQKPLDLTDRQLLAAELYCASFFDVFPRSRFITLVTAAEALLEQPDRCAVAQRLVSEMQTMVKEAAIDEVTKEAMTGSLAWLKKESIRQAGTALCERLLGERQYGGKVASGFFSDCYGLRSQIVHSGKQSEDTADLLQLANTAQGFVRDLLLASFGVADS